MTDEQSSGVSLTRRKVLAGLGAVGAAGAASGAGTFALFSDTASSSGNAVQAGTIDLVLSDRNQNDANSVSKSFTLANASPGESTNGNIYLRNDGSMNADHAEVAFAATPTEASGPSGDNGGDTMPNSAAGMAQLIKIEKLGYPGSYDSILSKLTDRNNNGIIDIDDLVSHGPIRSLKAPKTTGTTTLGVKLSFVDTASSVYHGTLTDNDFQGDELTVTVTFALAQKPGQHVL